MRSEVTLNRGTDEKCRHLPTDASSEPPNIDGARETARRTMRDENRASDVITKLRELFRRKEATAEFLDLKDVAQEVIS